MEEATKPKQTRKPKSKITALVPSEVPIYRYTHPYGSIAIYSPSNNFITPEKLLFLLEKAKFDLFMRHYKQ